MSEFSEALSKFKTPGTPKIAESNKEDSVFVTMSANRWIEQAKRRPIPKMLIGELMHEGELCILFSDTNMGKSIFAVQIADCLSRGVSICQFRCESPPRKVLYFDFEMSDK